MYSFYISMHAGHKPMNPPTSVTMPHKVLAIMMFDIVFEFDGFFDISFFLIDISDQLFLFVTTWHIILFIHNSMRRIIMSDGLKIEPTTLCTNGPQVL